MQREHTARPKLYRCRCESCGWAGYRRGYWRRDLSALVSLGDGVHKVVEHKQHVDSCPQCGAESVLGLAPKGSK